MSVRSRAARERKTHIARIARGMKRQHGHVRAADVAALAVSTGLKTSYPEVRTVLARIGLHR